MPAALRIAAAATVLYAGAAPAQSPRTVPLGRPDATFPEPVTSPAGFRALDSDRAIVADNIEGTLAIMDFRTGQVTPIARQGEGPGEYGMPGALYPGPGDTTYMMDMGNRRMLVVTPAGIAGSTISLSHPAGWPILPRGLDRQGRIYFDLGGIQMEALNDVAASGRAPLLRWDRGANRVDTVAYVAFPPMPAVGPDQVRIGGGPPYQARDLWAVRPDGRVGIARATGYRAEWHGAGAPVVGPEVAYDPVAIGTEEKNAWADQMAARAVAIEVRDGQRRTTRVPRPDINRQQWAEVMPPFVGPNAVITGPSGELWVLRSRPAKATMRVYDVFDAQGRLARRVSLEGERAILGFGPGVVFVGHTDDDDLIWIERFRIPT
jgi:hypothetical protein